MELRLLKPPQPQSNSSDSEAPRNNVIAAKECLHVQHDIARIDGIMRRQSEFSRMTH